MQRRFLAVSLLAALCTFPAAAEETDTLYQLSTIDALLTGLYDGVASFEQLRQHGDFGIGTFHALDGEMVAVDGRFFRVGSDGQVHEVEATRTTPFATVSFFRPEQQFALRDHTRDAVTRAVAERVGDGNLPHAVRIEGHFTRVKTRSVPAQRPPYPPLAEVAKVQSVFEFEDVRGVMVGYRLPGFFAKVNVPGYHLHFLTDDRRGGGHVLDFDTAEVTVSVDELPQFRMVLPNDEAFRKADLTPDRGKELERVER